MCKGLQPCKIAKSRPQSIDTCGVAELKGKVIILKMIQIPESLFVELMKYHVFGIEDSLPEIQKGLEQKYFEIFNKNIEMFNKFKDMGIAEEDLIYFYLGGQMCNVVTTMNARNLQWISRLRCCNKAQWQIRYIAKDMVKQSKEVAPLIGKGLGPTCVTNYICNEGKECCGLIDSILKNKK